MKLQSERDRGTWSAPEYVKVSSHMAGKGGTVTQFKPGNPGGPGRPKGVPNRIKADLAQMIINAAERVGFPVKGEDGLPKTGDGGCEGFLVWLGLYEPTTMAMLLARILPYYVKSEGNGGTVTQFKPGNPGGPGRPKGVPNRIKGDLAQMIMNAAERAGFIKKDKDGLPIAGDGGCEGFLLWLCLYDPRTMAGLLARILPYYVRTEVVVPELTREETLAQLKEIGLPIELLAHLRKAPARLDDDESDDPYGIKVTSHNDDDVMSPPKK